MEKKEFQFVEVDGKSFLIEPFNFNSARKSVERYLREFDDEHGRTFNIKYELTESKRMDVELDIISMRIVLNKIESDPKYLEPFVKQIRKKKNGLFWNKSGVTIHQMTNCTTYFTDFTNAWATPELRLVVLDDTTCELIFGERTYTI